LTDTFLVSVTVGIGHGVYRKVYTLFGGQCVEKFENHCPKAMTTIYLERKLNTTGTLQKKMR